MNPASPQQNKKSGLETKEEIISRFLFVQEKEISLRTQEFSLRKQSEDHQFEFAKTALDAKIKNENHGRHHQRLQLVIVCAFVLLLFVCILGFMGYAMHSGNQQIALEIIKAIVFLLSGGLGGYAFGQRRRAQQ